MSDALWRRAIVVDMHNDLASRVLDEHYDPDVRHGPEAGHTDLPRLVESGITAVFLAAWVDAPYALASPDASYARAMEEIDTIRAFAARHAPTLRLATTAADVRRAKREGAIAIGIGVEGGHAIEGSLEKLRALYERGARYLTLTWNNGNAWAGSSVGAHGTRTGGLTEFGAQVIREMNRLGMMVDVSHVSDATLDDVLTVSRAPVIATHSSARALADHPRNLTDAQLRAIAAAGGVVAVNFFPRFIDAHFRAAMDAADAEVRAWTSAAEQVPGADRAAVREEAKRRVAAAVARIPRTPLATLLDHIDHVACVAGVDHVALGSDFDGISATPEGMEDVACLPRLAPALLDRGWSEENLLRLLGGNVLRVMEDVLR